jgi:hypothetical protein
LQSLKIVLNQNQVLKPNCKPSRNPSFPPSSLYQKHAARQTKEETKEIRKRRKTHSDPFGPVPLLHVATQPSLHQTPSFFHLCTTAHPLEPRTLA